MALKSRIITFEFIVILSFLVAALPVTGAVKTDIDTLELKLENKSPVIRMSAVESLGKLRDHRAVKLLTMVLEDTHEDWKIRIRVINLLREIGDPATVDSIISALQHDPSPCPAIKWNAASALGRFSSHSRVIDALIYTLDDDTLYVREAAIQSLGESGSPRSVPFILSELQKHPGSFAIKLSVIKALGKIAGMEVIPLLEKLEKNDSDPLIKNEVKLSLEMISARNRVTSR